MTDEPRRVSETLGSVFSMVMPLAAILLLGAMNVAGKYDQNESTMRVLVFSAALSLVGVVSGMFGRKDAFANLGIGVSSLVFLFCFLSLFLPK